MFLLRVDEGFGARTIARMFRVEQTSDSIGFKIGLEKYSYFRVRPHSCPSKEESIPSIPPKYHPTLHTE
jgi:hypothetical protein